jgi:sugar lactone lactonase YvrE
MKKIFSFLSLLPVFILPGVNLHAQNPKLNNAFYFSSGIVVDSKGNAFVTGKNSRVIIITPDGVAALFAGSGLNDKDGTGKDAGFNSTGGIAIDSADNLYVTDNTKIRKITPDGIVSTIAGMTRAASVDGDKNTASFLHLENIAIDKKGNIYVTDYAPGKDWMPGRVTNSGYYLIRKITPAGNVSTLKYGDNNLLTLHYPRGLVCDNEGNLYISASGDHCIKKITPDNGITSVAGSAVLTSPSGIAIAKNGDIYFSDERLHRIIKVSGNRMTTVAGAGKISFAGNPEGAAAEGERDGKALQALFNCPRGIAFDNAGNLYIVDGGSKNNSYIRKLSFNGIVSTFCKHIWNPQTHQYEQAN